MWEKKSLGERKYTTRENETIMWLFESCQKGEAWMWDGQDSRWNSFEIGVS